MGVSFEALLGRIRTPIAAIIALAIFLPALVLAQTETGQITVRVVDPQGALVSDATVTVKSAAGATRTAKTSDEGVAVITNLLPGIYEVSVTASGFAPFTQKAQVTVGAKLSIEASLTVEARGEVIEVVAGEAGVEVNTQTQELSTVVSSKQILDLPTITRNPYALVGLSGNVSPTDPTGRGTGFAINGQRAASTEILLDGGENVDAFVAAVGQSVPLDAVQEFRVVTSNFSAEYGRASGGIVNVATKSGTNELHGTIYEFNRVSRLASNDFDSNAQGLPKSVFTRNQFGYSVGGPIAKQKLFFFNSTEWLRVRSAANVVNVVPTPELIAASAPATRNFFSKFPLARPINGRIFTRAEVTAALNVGAGAFNSLPANLPVFGESRYTVPASSGGGDPQNTYQTVIRIDWNASDKTQVYGRYALENSDFFKGTVSFSPYAGFDTGAETRNQNFLLSHTRSWSPRFITQSKLVFNRLRTEQPLGEQPPVPTLFLRSSVRTAVFGNLVALPGYLPFSPGSAIPFGGPQNFLQLFEDISWTVGKHQMRFGGQYVHLRDNRTFGAYQNAVASLSTTNLTEGLNNLVLGRLRQFQVAIDPQGRFFPGETVTLPVKQPNFSRSNRYHEFALYFNDSWRAKPTLTLNLGLRYEYYGVQHNARRELDSNFYFGPGANLFERIRNGRVFLAQDSPVGGLWRPDWNNFAPRLGFAWDLFGDGKTSLRGGYGIAYERNFGNVTFNVIQNPPNYAVVTIVAGTPGFTTIAIPDSNLGPLAGTSGTVALPGRLNVRHVNENIRTAYAHFWSLAFERELMRNTVVSLEYSGSAGRDLYDLTNPNRVNAAAAFLNEPPALSPEAIALGNPLSLFNRQYFPLNTRGNLGRSNYNGLTASIQNTRLRNLGLQFLARYTYSVGRDNLSSTFSESSNNFNLGLLDPFDPDLDYGFQDFDVRHRFVGQFDWEVPFARELKGVLGQILHGWQITGIYTARTGSPFTVFDCTNAVFQVCPRLVPTGPLQFDASGKPRPDPSGERNRFILVDLSNQTPGTYINPKTGDSEFGPFPPEMTKRNAFRGPGFWNVDFGLYKNFKISETKKIQFRSEFFNAFNHANLFVVGEEAEVNTAFGDGSIRGVPGNRSGRRQIQMAIKFIF
jgi:hypothetical protein